MCGLVGWFGCEGAELTSSPLDAALSRLRNRGPDGEGRWREPGVDLGHRRLAIIDLDERAAQPMHSACGRYVIAYNGEIYNFRALRAELERRGASFHTESDTEVILALFAAEGEAMMPRLHGMFAFMIWDKQERRVFAARDPYGIKPLYIAETANGLLVGSQVKALMATGLVSREPSIEGQAGFWMLGSVPEPYTWYKGIRALPAGSCVWFRNGEVENQYRWQDIGSIWRNARPVEAGVNVQARVRDALLESVNRHLVADVPVGVFLSGGIDSGAMAALMAEAGAMDVNGVTVAYEEFRGTHEDEVPAAKELAARYGIRHHIRRVTKEEFLDDLPKIFDAMDQPSIDGINTWYASKAVAEVGMKVVISGVGGDELFQGYPSFRQLPALLRWRARVRGIPGSPGLIAMLGSALSWWSGNARWKYLERWTRTIEGAWWLRHSIGTPEDVAAVMAGNPGCTPEQVLDVETIAREMIGRVPMNPELAVGQMESCIYLRNQLLRDADWASMYHGLELRTPLVDFHLLHQLQGMLSVFSSYPNKALLAHSPTRKLPETVVTRKKTGFGIPVRTWLKDSIQNEDGRTPGLGWARYVADSYAKSF